jgi:penicillin-binding protein A
MEFVREIERLLIGILMTLVVIGVMVAYWAAVGQETILQRDDNARRFEQRASIVRGEIVDRNGTTLVRSELVEGGRFPQRQYLHPAMNGALGYYSLRYGTGGVEAAFDAILSGDSLETSLETYISEGLLHRPRHGSDIRLTFDLDVQRTVVEVMESRRGAVVVLSVPEGEVLAMVSLPTYDPNTLDMDWETLITASGDPFFNRALQGSYQPGGAVQTILVTAALLSGVSLETEYDDADEPVTVADVQLECALQPLTGTLTLAEAYRFGCPAPFVQLAGEIGLQSAQTVLDLYHVGVPVTLLDVPEIAALALSEGTLQMDDALGQGALTISPLRMATIAASIINAGNAPQPHVLLETRHPGEEIWTPARQARQSLPVTTIEISRRIQFLMRETVSSGNARAASHDRVNIGGHAALAHSGDETLVWFVGFARMGDRMGAAVAVVLEDSDDLVAAAGIGRTALEAAVETLYGLGNE